MGLRIGEHLHHVSVLQLVAQRNDLPVDLAADAAIADVRVDGEGKIHRRSPAREALHIPLGGEDEDLVGEQVDLDRLQEFLGVLEVLLPLHQLAKPGELLIVFRDERLAFLVCPVGRNPFLGDPVHLLGADLDLHPFAHRANHGGVQRLVHVRLGDGDEVLEAAGDRLPELVDEAERLVARGHGGHDQAEGDHVVDLVEVDPLRLHLLVDRIDVLEATGNTPLDLALLQLSFDQVNHLLDVPLALLPPPVHLFQQVGILLRLQVPQGEVLELRLDPADPEPVGQRGIDVQGLPGDALLLLLRHVLQRAHVVGTVRQLHQDDADVLRHGDDHLPEILRLFLFLGQRRRRGELRQLGDPIHQLRDFRAKQLGQLLGRGQRVLDRVVEQTGDDRRLVQMKLSEYSSHLQGVDEVGLPRIPKLTLMNLRRVDVSLLDRVEVWIGVVGDHPLQDVIETYHSAYSIVTGEIPWSNDRERRPRHWTIRGPGQMPGAHSLTAARWRS